MALAWTRRLMSFSFSLLGRISSDLIYAINVRAGSISATATAIVATVSKIA